MRVPVGLGTGHSLPDFVLSSVQPRSNIARLSEKKGVPPDLVARLARMEGAHLVCFLVECNGII